MNAAVTTPAKPTIPTRARIVAYMRSGQHLKAQELCEALVPEGYNLNTIVSTTHAMYHDKILGLDVGTSPRVYFLNEGVSDDGRKAKTKRRAKKASTSINTKRNKNIVTLVQNTPTPRSYDQVVKNKVPVIIDGIIKNYSTGEIAEIIIGLRTEVAKLFGFDAS
jgi:hypothetical protein